MKNEHKEIRDNKLTVYNAVNPNIAQMVEHPTVVVKNMKSGGHRFKSDCSEGERQWCNGNMNPFQGFAEGSIPS